VKENSCHLISDAIQAYEKPQWQQPIYRLKFEPGTYQTRTDVLTSPIYFTAF
jgi:hypothetical protein